MGNVFPKQTHYFEFVPEKQGFYEFAASNKTLYAPEDAGLAMFPILVAGLGPEDLVRIKIYAFSDRVIGDIFTLVSGDSNDSPDDVGRINMAGLRKAEEFVREINAAGFSTHPIKIVEGESMLTKKFRGGVSYGK